jgi:fructokinase
MILVCGEALIDLTPEPGGLYRPCPGGGPFNTAVALGRLGVPVAFLGSVSRDALGRLLADRLAGAGVALRHTIRSTEPTPLAVVALSSGAGHENEFSFYMTGTAAPNVTVDDLPGDLDGVDALHIGTLGLVLEPLATTIELLVAREAAQRVIALDPNVRPSLVHDRAAFTIRIDRLAAASDLVKVSDADALWLAPRAGVPDLVAQWQAAGAGIVLVTRGGSGSVAWAPSGALVEVPAVPADVVDTVGAGDSFNAGLLAWLHREGRLTKQGVRSLSESDLRAALAHAATVAAITCSRAGADPPWHHELPG